MDTQKIERKIARLEAPARIAELAPASTLPRLGLRPGMSFCDIGAGTGLFTFAARAITQPVHALELDTDLLAHIQQKAASLGLEGITCLPAQDAKLGMPPHSIDMAFMCTVLHELASPKEALAEIKAMLRPTGILGIIEFHKAATPAGPPVVDRIAAEDAASLLQQAGFQLNETLHLSDNFYCQSYSLAK